MPFSLDREKLRQDYASQLAVLQALEQEGVYEITAALAKEGLKFHSIVSRVKSLVSITNKAEEKEFENPLSDLTDVVGIRVVALFLGDIERIVTVFHEIFDIQSIDDKIQDGDLSRFGYLSVHLLAKFKNSFSGTRYDQIKNMVFEIQIRTIAMDAWASASHYLDYKSEEDIPTDLKRDFHALSGLFYVADKHFEMFFRSRQAAVREVRKLSKNNDLLEQEINLDTLSEYLLKKYPNRREVEKSAISVLVTSIREMGLQTLRQLDTKLTERASFLSQKEQGRTGGQFNRVGAVRISFAADPEFEPTRPRPDLPS